MSRVISRIFVLASALIVILSMASIIPAFAANVSVSASPSANTIDNGADFTVDLVINTEKISPDLAATWLVDAINSLGSVQEPGKPAVSSLEIDPILKKAVSDALKCTMTHK